MVHLVSYTLHGHYRFPQDYQNLEDAIRSISGTYLHLGGGRWLVESQLASQQIAERLAPLTIVGDQILVFRLERDWYGYGFTPEQDQWLKQRDYASVWETLAKIAPLPIPKPIASGLSAALSLLAPSRGTR